MTESSYASGSTATPPKLLGTGLDLDQSDLSELGNMFGNFGKSEVKLVEEPEVLGTTSTESSVCLDPLMYYDRPTDYISRRTILLSVRRASLPPSIPSDTARLKIPPVHGTAILHKEVYWLVVASEQQKAFLSITTSLLGLGLMKFHPNLEPCCNGSQMFFHKTKRSNGLFQAQEKDCKEAESMQHARRPQESLRTLLYGMVKMSNWLWILLPQAGSSTVNPGTSPGLNIAMMKQTIQLPPWVQSPTHRRMQPLGFNNHLRGTPDSDLQLHCLTAAIKTSLPFHGDKVQQRLPLEHASVNWSIKRNVHCSMYRLNQRGDRL